MTETSHLYGWRPQLPDQRDFQFSPKTLDLPPMVDLRGDLFPSIYDQGALGSCTAQAVAAHHYFVQAKEGEQAILPSRLKIYYDERADQHTISQDSGATIRESVKAVAKYGACAEAEWPYIIAKFRKKPSRNCYVDGMLHQATQYFAVAQTLAAMQGCLADGYPFLIGISVYQSFESATAAQTGIIPMPSSRESLLGGHALCVVGYDTALRHFVVRNSWGAGWGDKGYCYLPFDYLLSNHLSSDFWTIRKVE